MGAFRPIDVYPCTADEENWSWDMSVENLFGHLCSGTTFAHDRRMEDIANHRECQPWKDDNSASQIMTSREGSIELDIFHGISHHDVGVKAGHSGPTSLANEPRNSHHRLKRKCLSLSGNESNVDVFGMGKNPQQLQRVRRVFKDMIRERAVEADPLALTSSNGGLSSITIKQNPTSAATMSRTLSTINRPTIKVLRDSRRQRHFLDHHQCVADGLSMLSDQMRTEIIRSPPKSSCSSYEKTGEFLVDEMHGPTSISNTLHGSQSDPDTQVSLSDAIFESQSPQFPHTETVTREQKVQRRKEAYKVAKRLTWKRDHRLVSSLDGQGAIELEL